MNIFLDYNDVNFWNLNLLPLVIPNGLDLNFTEAAGS